MASRTRVSATREICKYTLPPIAELWLLRLLVPLGGHQEFIKSHGFREELLARVIGLANWIESDDFDVKKVLADLRKLHAAAERKYRNVRVPDCLAENISRLATLVGLSDTDCRVLELAVFLHTERMLDDAGTIKAAREFSQGIASFYWVGGGVIQNPDFAWMWDKYRFRDWTPLP